MARATTSLEDMLARHPDYAMPHAILDNEQRRIPVRPIYAPPAGAVCASIAEMAAWMRFHLDPVTGRDGLRLSPAAAAAAGMIDRAGAAIVPDKETEAVMHRADLGKIRGAEICGAVNSVRLQLRSASAARARQRRDGAEKRSRSRLHAAD
jgi:hypothetical protein